MKMKISIETAMQIVIIDAMEKGHTSKNELIEYMNSKAFETAVKKYMENEI